MVIFRSDRNKKNGETISVQIMKAGKNIPLKARRTAFAHAAAALLYASSVPLHAGDESRLEVLTDVYPPYSYVDDTGTVAGISVEKVTGILEASGVPYNIVVMPWSRALQRAQTRPNSLIFSLNRTPEREHQFEWLVALNRVEYHLIGLASAHSTPFSRKTTINGPATVLCEAGSSPCAMLLAYGFRPHSILPIPDKSPADLVRLLLRGRATYLISDPAVLLWHAEKIDNKLALKTVDFVGQGVTDYLAAGKQVPERLVHRIRRASFALEQSP